MNHLVAMNSDATMDSLDFLREIINPARIGCGEPEVKNTHFVSRVEDELDDLPAVKIIHRFGNEVRSYDLTIDQMMLVGMRESKAVRKTVLAKLKEIKNPSLPDFNDPVAAARAWADAKEQALIAEEKLAIAAPKIEAFDRVMDRENLINATQVAQQVGISAIKLNKHIDAIGGVYNKAVKRGRVFCQSWIDGGYGEMKQTDQGFPQTLFTTKGSMRIIEMLTSEGII